MSSSIYGGRGFGTGNVSQSGATGDIIPKRFKQGQLRNFTPEQQQLFQQLFEHLSPDSFLSQLAGGDVGMFEQAEAPALRQFSDIQGNIASRFSGMGTGGRKSSGFQNAMNQASSDFAQDLQSKRMDIQRQAILDLLGLSSSLLGQKPYDRFLVEKPQKKTSFLDQILGPLGSLIGMGAKSFFS